MIIEKAIQVGWYQALWRSPKHGLLVGAGKSHTEAMQDLMEKIIWLYQ